MSDGILHTDVGAYALELLDGTDRETFELHLTWCGSCATELTDLSPLRDLLRALGPLDAGPDPVPVPMVAGRRLPDPPQDADDMLA